MQDADDQIQRRDETEVGPARGENIAGEDLLQVLGALGRAID